VGGLWEALSGVSSPNPNELLQDPDSLYRSLVAGMSEGMAVYDAQGALVTCNAAVEELTGRTVEQLRGMKPQDVPWAFLREDGTPVSIDDHPVLQALRTGEPQMGVVLGADPPGAPRMWLRFNVRPLGPVGVPDAPAVMATFTDITAERHTIEELEATRQRYQTLIETLPLVTYVDPVEYDRPVTFISPQVEEMFGYPASDWIDREDAFFPQLLHPEEHERVYAWYDETSGLSDEPARMTYRMRDREGRTLWIEDASTNVRDQQTGEITAIGYLRDVTVQVDTEERLRSANARMSALIENLGAGVLAEDENGRIVFVNEEFCRTFGFPPVPEDIVGRDVGDIVEAAIGLAIDPVESRAQIEALRATGQRLLGIQVGLADGSVFAVDHVPTLSEGVARGCLWVFRDVSDRAAIQRELAAARDDALRASRAKGDFLATMSHEIRTPMNGIVATAELLEEHDLDPEAAELLRIVRDAAHSLQGILDDVLDFSKIESGTQTVHPAPFDLRATVRGVAELLAPAGTRKGIAVRAELAPDLPGAVLGDEGLVRQVLVNLAGNAVKFTTTGEVVLLARPAAGDPGRIALAVIDSGPGIAASARKRLFEPFYQVESSASRQHGGTGLGLAITDHLVHLMDGEIVVDSEVGEGTTFTVTLPFGESDEVLAPDEPQPLVPEDVLLQGSVLLVEDNATNRAVGLRQLLRLGLDAEAVDSGEEAVRVVAACRWDCVLMDCQMPGMDGFAATRAIRRAEGDERHTPIVALTANAMQGDREACLTAGMDDYLAKPVRLAVLQQMLARWLPGADPATAAPAGPVAAVPDDPGTPLDEGVLAELDEELGEDVALLVGMYLTELEPRRAAISDAVAARDLEAARAAAHSLRGASGTFGALRLGELCAELEHEARAGRPDELPRLVAQIEVEADAVGVALAAVRDRVEPEG
jgi:PAS domain S-box-containing protein